MAGFAQSAHVLELLDFIPIVGNLMRFLAMLLTFFAVWIGVATAHELRGWRTFLLPVIYLLSLAIGFISLIAFISGTGFAFETLMSDFGLMP